MNYNNMLCNYCASYTGNSNFNIRIIKPSNKKDSNNSRIMSNKKENRINNKIQKSR